MTYVIDIDGVVCTTYGTDYVAAVPVQDVIDRIALLKQQGHRIIFHTARGTVSNTDWREVTERQFARWGLPYDELHFGKPAGDVYIDDKALNVSDWIQL